MFVQKCGWTPNVTRFCSENIVHLSPPFMSYGMPELHHKQFQERTTVKTNEEQESPATVTFDLWVWVKY